MKSVQATELRKTLYGEIRKLAKTHEPVVILRHGKPIAVLTSSVDVPAGRRKPLLDLDAIAAFCRRHQVRRFSLFGSILRRDFDKDSDVDVLIDTGGRGLGFHEECRMLDDLEDMFGRKVDLVTTAMLDSEHMNPHRRASIAATARLIHDEAA